MNDIRHQCARDVAMMRRWRWLQGTVADLGLAIVVVTLAYLSTNWS